MRVTEIMTRDPVTARRDTALPEVARRMAEHDCGAIPVLEREDGGRPVGIVTDRDIAIRCVARGEDARIRQAADVMTDRVVTVRPDDDVEDVAEVMRENEVRRVLVTEDDGRLVGMVSQADVARKLSAEETGRTVREISEPSEKASAATRA